MSETLAQVQKLVARGNYLVSNHAYDELVEDAILVEETIAGVFDARLVEDYPLAARGASVLVFQRDTSGRPIHVVWGFREGFPSPLW